MSTSDRSSSNPPRSAPNTKHRVRNALRQRHEPLGRLGARRHRLRLSRLPLVVPIVLLLLLPPPPKSPPPISLLDMSIEATKCTPWASGLECSGCWRKHRRSDSVFRSFVLSMSSSITYTVRFSSLGEAGDSLIGFLIPKVTEGLEFSPYPGSAFPDRFSFLKFYLFPWIACHVIMEELNASDLFAGTADERRYFPFSLVRAHHIMQATSAIGEKLHPDEAISGGRWNSLARDMEFRLGAIMNPWVVNATVFVLIFLMYPGN